MAAPLKMLCITAFRQTSRSFTSTCTIQAGTKWRLENGLSRSGSEYGPLTDLPDWSYADGRPAPPMKGQTRRRAEREAFARRAVYLNAEMDQGMQKWREKKEEEEKMEEQRKAQLLKPKGNLLLKTKK
ncbi:large ribosomal subunit protein mL52 [Chanos chanos]|uniref:Large ribosomal subunit protein mL52 n=1 Tax=Chanos chanos TaxID=29144 RepID=A0A6J2VUE0_CHACN|nr:39S ribosomal protein L52, mitochondrial [Chanos chanos]